QHTLLHGRLDTRVHRRDVLTRDPTAGDRVGELVELVLRGLQRLEGHLDLRELTRTTGLLLVRVVDLLRLATDRLAVRDLRLADVGLDLELPLHAVDEDVEVELAHTADDGLA